MRHKVKTDSFSRFSSYRKATLKSLAISVLINQKIITTKAKAKSARRLVEKVITLGKKNNLAAKRRAFSILCDHKLVKRLFDQIAPIFANRVGGYTRIIPYKYQRGDNAQLVILELTEILKEKKPEKKIKEKQAKPEETKAEEPVVVAEEKRVPETPAAEEKKKKEQPKEKPVRAEAPEKKELPKVEKKIEVEKKPAKPLEEKKPKNLFGGFKGLFRKDKGSR